MQLIGEIAGVPVDLPSVLIKYSGAVIVKSCRYRIRRGERYRVEKSDALRVGRGTGEFHFANNHFPGEEYIVRRHDCGGGYIFVRLYGNEPLPRHLSVYTGELRLTAVLHQFRNADKQNKAGIGQNGYNDCRDNRQQKYFSFSALFHRFAFSCL